MPSQWSLLLADTDETQAYVFESNKLPEIRGASRLLDDLNRVECPKLIQQAGGTVIYAGGGTVLAKIPTAQSNLIVRSLEAQYVHSTGGATITAVARELPQGFDETRDFGPFVSHVANALRARKESRETALFLPALPFQSRCQSCQTRPADAVLSRQLNQPDYAICAVCHTKHVNGTLEQRDYWLDKFREAVHGTATWSVPELHRPYSISEIADASQSAEKLVGVVHLDGDRIGRLLSSIDSAEQFRSFSKAIDVCARSAVLDVLSTTFAPRQVTPSELRPNYNAQSKVTIYPFEIVTIGGDDIWLIVPAESALAVATDIATRFGNAMSLWTKTNAGLENDVTMSAGVVLADDHTPVRLLASIARQLIANAKQLGGAVDFQVLHAPEALYLTVNETRKAYPYTLPDIGAKKLRLINRPYRHDRMQRLLDDINRLRSDEQATSQLQLLSAALLRGRRDATLFFAYQSHRKSVANQYAVLRDVLENQQIGSAHDPLPWLKLEKDAEYGYATAIWDIAELLPFALR